MVQPNRVAVVTGASSGIGRAIATRLAGTGAAIVVADVQRDPQRGSHFQTDVTIPTDVVVEEQHGVDGQFVETDTGDPASVELMVEETIDAFGRLDVLVNNAGIIEPGSSQEVTVEQYRRLIDVNLNGYFYTAKYAIPHLRDARHGRIVNISSVNAHYGGSGAGYAASKAGIVNLTRDLALEVADANVTVNAILPGVIKTQLQDVDGDAAIERRKAHTPLPRLGEPDDVAAATAFFASEEAEWITGAELLVDGGYLAGRH